MFTLNSITVPCMCVTISIHLFARVMAEIKDKFEPEVVVVQCGADGLHGDPMQSFNLTIQGLGNCVAFILNWQLPTLLLGGGESTVYN